MSVYRSEPSVSTDSMHRPQIASRPHPLTFYAVDETVFEVCWHEPPVASAQIPEALVQDIWRLQQFRTADLRTTDGRRVQVIHPGRLNRDGGPDFLASRVLIAGREVSGPVEIHTSSSGWYDHGHHRDAAYAGVALHVTLEHDLWTGRLRTSAGNLLPEIVLRPHLEAPLQTLLFKFRARGNAPLPCTGRWSTVEPGIVSSWLDRLAEQRLSNKVRLLESRYLERPDPSQLLYELVLTGLGYAKNAVPMLELARRIPLGLLHEQPSREAAQAALLGTAGLLPEPATLRSLGRSDIDFVMLLRELYATFRMRHDIMPMRPEAWQFFRLRPSNFPAIRIAQAGALAARTHDGPLAPGGDARIHSALLSEHPRRLLEQCFRIDPGTFWHGHVRVDRRARRGFPYLGRQRINALLVNAVAPVFRLRAEHEADEPLTRALTVLLRSLPADDDEVTRIFASLGAPPASGYHAQGYHQLFRSYCREGMCLSCSIGRAIFTQRRTDKQNV